MKVAMTSYVAIGICIYVAYIDGSPALRHRAFLL